MVGSETGYTAFSFFKYFKYAIIKAKTTSKYMIYRKIKSQCCVIHHKWKKNSIVIFQTPVFNYWSETTSKYMQNRNLKKNQCCLIYNKEKKLHSSFQTYIFKLNVALFQIIFYRKKKFQQIYN